LANDMCGASTRTDDAAHSVDSATRARARWAHRRPTRAGANDDDDD